MPPSKITNHREQAIARLPFDLRNAPRLVAIASALLAPLQPIEDALWQLHTERNLDTATGVTLEEIGGLVGEPPSGLDEDTYRRRIRARIRTNRSSGSGPCSRRSLSSGVPRTCSIAIQTSPSGSAPNA